MIEIQQKHKRKTVQYHPRYIVTNHKISKMRVIEQLVRHDLID